MNCEDFGRSIQAFLQDQLDPSVRADFEQHRDGCSPCALRLTHHTAFRCREFVDFLGRFVDGELGVEEREVFEVHIGRCPPCGDYLESYRQTVALARRGRGGAAGPDCDEMPPELTNAILAALKARE